jgi:predicted RecA/RadA family phage recombinase
MKNFIAEGCNVTVAAPSGGTTSGNAYLVGGIFGVAATTQLVSEDVVLVTEGIFNLTKVGSQAWSVGDYIYWDDANARCTSVAGDGIYVGVAVEAVGSGAGLTTGKVRLNSIVPVTQGGIVSATASTLTVTAAKHAGKVVLLDRAAGVTVTLPAASGSGSVYEFIVKTTFSGGSGVIKVANSSDAFIGFSLIVSDDAGAPAKGYIASPASDDTITLNGTTTGGYVGDKVVIRDIAANVFSVEVRGKATGTEATPFSATV